MNATTQDRPRTIDTGVWPELSFARKFMLWYMKSPPFSPYVNLTFAADFSEAQRYLVRRSSERG